MLSTETIAQVIPNAFEKLEIPGDLPHGKVCDFYVTQDGKRRVLIATDRLNVFDHVVGLVPYHGQVINELSGWWFQHTTDIIPNHYISMPDPNVTIAREAEPISLSVVVRGYITGVTPTSLWPRYQAGERELYGMKFPDNLKKNDPLPAPIVTPTTKATLGRGNRNSVNSVVDEQYASAEVWKQITDAALALFSRGQEIASKTGLILVDSKYEFGFDPENHALILIDELHTPESSRYWKADTYDEYADAGREPENLDKELARLWYTARGYQDGQKEFAPMDEKLITAISRAYQEVYERITGTTFQPASYPVQNRVAGLVAEVA